MREYELTVVYDLSVQEAGGPDAGPQRLTQLVEARKGKILKIDHWGRRRMAYPIKHAIDGDYLVTRVEMEPGDVSALEAALRIDERVYRHLVVRADELPLPPPPREPREPRPAATDAPAASAAPAPAAAAPAAEAAPAEAAPEAAPEVAAGEEAPQAEPEAAAEAPAEAAAEAPAEAAAEPPVADAEAETPAE